MQFTWMQFSFFILCYIIDIFFIALFVSIFAPLWQQQMGLSTSQSPRLWPLFWGKSAPYGVAWYWLIDWNKNASIFPKIIRKRNNDFLETFVKHKSQWNRYIYLEENVSKIRLVLLFSNLYEVKGSPVL